MYDRFLTFIKKEQLLDETGCVLLALSGGVDSMVMADFFIQAKIPVAVAHVNYHLRDKQSDMDEALVRRWCCKNDVTCHVHHVPLDAYDSGESIQMVARNERYAFFDLLVNDHQYVLIATAHNADDNLETVLLNLTKGTGIKGLIGIAPKKNRLIRPLLFATKQEVYEYAHANRIQWREDKSNQKSTYQRNRIRNLVIPELEKINPNLRKTFGETLERIKGTAELVQCTVAQLQEQEVVQGDLRILKTDWVKPSRHSQVLMSEWLRPFGFSFALAKEVVGSIHSGAVGAIFHTEDYTLNVDRNQVIVKPKDAAEMGTFWISEDLEGVELVSGKVTFDRVSGNHFEKSSDGHLAFFDLAKLKFPLKLRGWLQGDVFQPLGMQGKKKVSDFMIDSKIPVTLKSGIMILESAGNIAWIVGYRTDDRFKVTPQTTTMLKVQFTRHV